MKLWVFLLLSLLFPFQNVWAGYRVYKLKVINYDEKGKPIRTETVLSTLDHTQYEHYNSGYRWMRVTLIDTWYCEGDTSGYRSYCNGPKVKNANEKSALPYNRQPITP